MSRVKNEKEKIKRIEKWNKMPKSKKKSETLLKSMIE